MRFAWTVDEGELVRDIILALGEVNGLPYGMVVGLIVEMWMKGEASEWCMATCDGTYGDVKAFGVALLWVCLLVCGCRKAVEFHLANELKPVTERDLVEMSERDLDRVDIARMNLICALAVAEDVRNRVVDSSEAAEAASSTIGSKL